MGRNDGTLTRDSEILVAQADVVTNAQQQTEDAGDSARSITASDERT